MSLIDDRGLEVEIILSRKHSHADGRCNDSDPENCTETIDQVGPYHAPIGQVGEPGEGVSHPHNSLEDALTHWFDDGTAYSWFLPIRAGDTIEIGYI